MSLLQQPDQDDLSLKDDAGLEDRGETVTAS